MYKIIETCTACGLCVPECPIDAISIGDPIYIIDDSCCDFEDCLAVCPVDAIIPVVDDDEVLPAATHQRPSLDEV
jgi:ferredoxin